MISGQLLNLGRISRYGGILNVTEMERGSIAQYWAAASSLRMMDRINLNWPQISALVLLLYIAPTPTNTQR
jgi:hypothetical protein